MSIPTHQKAVAAANLSRFEAPLSQATRALLLRNSRLAEEVLNSPADVSAQVPDRVIEHHIRSISRLALSINEEPQLKAYDDVALLTEKVLGQFSASLNQLSAIREIFERISKDIQALMKKTPNNVHRGVNLILAANHYVQIAECLVLACRF